MFARLAAAILLVSILLRSLALASVRPQDDCYAAVNA